MGITIHNLRREKPKHPWDVRVDRSSVLGNPFTMGTEAERNKRCNQYDHWLLEQIGERGRVYQEMLRLYHIHKEYGELRLFCWCAPKRCHAESIKSFLEQHI